MNMKNSSQMHSLLTLFFLANAIFWVLFHHSQHCKLADMFGMKDKCPPHWIHVYVIGLGSFLIALYLKQGRAGL